jgi:hypothetical protein
MPRWADEAEDWDRDPGFEDEEDDDDLPGDDEGGSTIPCPYCRREIHEDSQRCPYCEHYISREDAPPGRKPWWIILGVGACLYVVYRWIVMR